MWKHSRERFHVVKVRVLHPRIPTSSNVHILCGVPEGSMLIPTLFGIFVADLIHELRVQFPTANITHNGGVRWIGGIFYVDDLCLISTDAREFQRIMNTCQTWSEKARMQLNAEKTKVMCFQKPSRPAMPENDHEQSRVIKCGQHHFTSFLCSQTIPNPQRDLINTQDLFAHFCKR